MFDLIEVGDWFAAHVQPQTLQGLGAAVAFLVVMRSIAWLIKGRTNSQLATSIITALDNIHPKEVSKYNGNQYNAGHLAFGKKHLTIDGVNVRDRLSFRERRAVNKKIKEVVTRCKTYENEKMASKIGLTRQSAPALATMPAMPLNIPQRVEKVNVNPLTALKDCFQGKHEWRSIKGVAEQLGWNEQIVLTLLASQKYQTKASKKGGLLYSLPA